MGTEASAFTHFVTPLFCFANLTLTPKLEKSKNEQYRNKTEYEHKMQYRNIKYSACPAPPGVT